jgi:hypothetical protein
VYTCRCALQIQHSARSYIPSGAKCSQYDLHFERLSSGSERDRRNFVKSHRRTSENPKCPTITSEEDSQRRIRKIIRREVSSNNMHELNAFLYVSQRNSINILSQTRKAKQAHRASCNSTPKYYSLK